MKILNRKLIKGTNWALAGILTLLGFSGCDDNDEGGGGGGLMLEYGTPHANFIVTGKVTDTAGNALKGIQIVVPGVDHCQRTTTGFIPDHPVISEERKDTLYTESNGQFEYQYNGFPTDTTRIHMKFEDIAVDARFAPDSTSVSFLRTDLKGGKGWSQGQAKKEINIKLINN